MLRNTIHISSRPIPSHPISKIPSLSKVGNDILEATCACIVGVDRKSGAYMRRCLLATHLILVGHSYQHQALRCLEDLKIPPCPASLLGNINSLFRQPSGPQKSGPPQSPGTALDGCCRRWARPMQAPANAATDGALQQPDFQLCGAPSTATSLQTALRQHGSSNHWRWDSFIIPCPPSGGLATRRWSRLVILRPYAC